jgi:hypothetical protein
VSITGTSLDYFANTPLPNVQISAEGLGNTTTSTGGGTFDLMAVPAHTTTTLLGSLVNYRPTRNESIVVGTASVISDLRMVSNTDANRQYVAASIAQAGGTAIVFVDLLDSSGQPRAGLPLTDLRLQDQSASPVGAGPYVIGASGDVDPALTVTTTFNSQSRIAFLNVPAGPLTLRVDVTAPSPATLTAPVLTSPGSATLVRR